MKRNSPNYERKERKISFKIEGGGEAFFQLHETNQVHIVKRKFLVKK